MAIATLAVVEPRPGVSAPQAINRTQRKGPPRGGPFLN